MVRPGWRPVGELADGIGDPAPHGLAFVIVLRGELVGARSAFFKGPVAVALSMRLAARQISISGITGDKLHALDRQSFNTKDHVGCNVRDTSAALVRRPEGAGEARVF